MYMTNMYLLSSEIHISEYIFKHCQHIDWKKI